MAQGNSLKERLYHIIFLNDTKAGHRFDLIITCLIILSVIVVMLESVAQVRNSLGGVLSILEWVFTVLFTIEYGLRLYSARSTKKYAVSFFGIVDFLSVIPSYLAFMFIGMHELLIIRILRLLRVFRIFEMGHFVREGAIVANALRASRVKITVFLSFVVIASIFTGAIMYMAESRYNPAIQNIPQGIFWAIETLTTVGYGDTIPVTAVGKFLAAVVMVLGYGVIAVPTGIVTAEISYRVLGSRNRANVKCPVCGASDLQENSSFCYNCGSAVKSQEMN
jgi:voltage-gated potassium channel